MAENNLNRVLSFLSNKYLALILRLILGIMFIISAQSKLLHHSDFVIVVKEYDLLPGWLASAYGNALPWVELLVGVYLILAIFMRPTAIVCFFMGVSFMIANITAVVRGYENCGSCFGDLVILPVYQAIIIDVLVLASSAILIFSTPQRQFLALDSLVRIKDNEPVDSINPETS